jgi:hypothetical protein
MEAEDCKRRFPCVGRVLGVSIQLTDVVVGSHLRNDSTKVKKSTVSAFINFIIAWCQVGGSDASDLFEIPERITCHIMQLLLQDAASRFSEPMIS